MPKIRCHYLDCTYLDDRYCCAAAIELNPDSGCQTYAPDEEAEAPSWDEDVDDEWDNENSEEEPEDLWASDDDDSDDEEEDEADPY